MNPPDTGLCVCDHVKSSHTDYKECTACTCHCYLPKITAPKTIPSITDVYGYIRTEILYCQRRHKAAIQEYKRNHWYERWSTLHDAGTAFGMVNLPKPGTHEVVGK